MQTSLPSPACRSLLPAWSRRGAQVEGMKPGLSGPVLQAPATFEVPVPDGPNECGGSVASDERHDGRFACRRLKLWRPMVLIRPLTRATTPSRLVGQLACGRVQFCCASTVRTVLRDLLALRGQWPRPTVGRGHADRFPAGTVEQHGGAGAPLGQRFGDNSADVFRDGLLQPDCSREHASGQPAERMGH